jgi:cardiolipin synthase
LRSLARLEVGSDSGLAERAFARAAGSMPIDGNSVRLLQDAAENYPAWLSSIQEAQHQILFENYIVDDDEVGREFAEALAGRARAGVDVRIVYDWLGSLRARKLWPLLLEAGAKVQAFNRPRLDSPLGWVTRDHRKTLTVDGQVSFVSGLCVSNKWLGDPARDMDPWRDTGIEIKGPAVAEITQAFEAVWHACTGEWLPDDLPGAEEARTNAGNVRLRVVAGVPSTAGTYRLDLVIASLARKRLWISDAYFVGTSAYVQALAAAARDGVDVRLLVPGASDIPALSPISRAGYRPLLDAGVRVYEWNGTMMHAKTAVADDLWARIGSTNLNIVSWMGNYELDVAIEDRGFGALMAAQYERDLEQATEIVLTGRNRVGPTDRGGTPTARRARAGSAGRVAAGAVSMGSALGAALTNRRRLGAAESGLLAKVSAVALAFAIVAAWWPRIVAWPLGVLAAWVGIAWLAKAYALRNQRAKPKPVIPAVSAEPGKSGGEMG